VNSQISRRDFLKMLTLASFPFLGVRWPRLAGDMGNLLQSKRGPNILVLIFDTLSAHHLSLHGYQRETTPNLARFAERATVYHSHHAGASFTSPGVASIFTGCLAHYGITRAGQSNNNDNNKKPKQDPQPPSKP